MRFEIAEPAKRKAPSTRKDAVKIGERLNADAVIYGNVKMEEAILKISLEMVNVKNGSLFASEGKWIKGN